LLLFVGGQKHAGIVGGLLQHQLNIALMLVVKPGKTDRNTIFTLANHMHPLTAQLLGMIHCAIEKQLQQSANLDVGVF
jgi:hypothetical protein